MKQKVLILTRRYLAALRQRLQGGPSESLQPALRIGRQAVAFGLETLELARIHEQAAVALKLSAGAIEQRWQAEAFFTEAITPILETHQAARKSQRQLGRLNATLIRRTWELAASNRQLKDGVRRRKHVEAAFRKSRGRYAKMLKDSLQLQEALRQVTREALVVQEEQRRKLSRELQDEIAQTLLGINVRLLSLKRQAGHNARGIEKEIAGAQKLIGDSAHSTRQVARKLRNK